MHTGWRGKSPVWDVIYNTFGGGHVTARLTHINSPPPSHIFQLFPFQTAFNTSSPPTRVFPSDSRVRVSTPVMNINAPRESRQGGGVRPSLWEDKSSLEHSLFNHHLSDFQPLPNVFTSTPIVPHLLPFSIPSNLQNPTRWIIGLQVLFFCYF
jgi:hypothetical protein